MGERKRYKKCYRYVEGVRYEMIKELVAFGCERFWEIVSVYCFFFVRKLIFEKGRVVFKVIGVFVGS